jgi:hypothetical protein
MQMPLKFPRNICRTRRKPAAGVHAPTYTPQLAAFEKPNLHFNQTQMCVQKFRPRRQIGFHNFITRKEMFAQLQSFWEKVDNRDLGAVSSADPRASPAASAVRPTGGCGENF